MIVRVPAIGGHFHRPSFGSQVLCKFTSLVKRRTRVLEELSEIPAMCVYIEDI